MEQRCALLAVFFTPALGLDWSCPCHTVPKAVLQQTGTLQRGAGADHDNETPDFTQHPSCDGPLCIWLIHVTKPAMTFQWLHWLKLSVSGLEVGWWQPLLHLHYRTPQLTILCCVEE